jgi:hypothetical protein
MKAELNPTKTNLKTFIFMKFCGMISLFIVCLLWFMLNFLIDNHFYHENIWQNHEQVLHHKWMLLLTFMVSNGIVRFFYEKLEKTLNIPTY